MSDAPPPDGAVARFFGWVLVVISGLVIVFSGLCTGFGLLVGLAAMFSGPTPSVSKDGVFKITLLAGVLPLIVSIGVFILGMRVIVANSPGRPKAGIPDRGEGDRPPNTVESPSDET
jgi:hypothetical protein